MVQKQGTGELNLVHEVEEGFIEEETALYPFYIFPLILLLLHLALWYVSTQNQQHSMYLKSPRECAKPFSYCECMKILWLDLPCSVRLPSTCWIPVYTPAQCMGSEPPAVQLTEQEPTCNILCYVEDVECIVWAQQVQHESHNVSYTSWARRTLYRKQLFGQISFLLILELYQTWWFWKSFVWLYPLPACKRLSLWTTSQELHWEQMPNSSLSMHTWSQEDLGLNPSSIAY